MPDLQDKLKSLPQKPGVYLFKDGLDRIIYIGKAKALKNRVRSYFIKNAWREARTEIMIRLIADLDYMVVSTELESLILENILIKRHKPRFNVLLRDDKNYQFIKLDYGREIPQIYTVRKLTPSSSPPYKGGEREGFARYFGPYTSGLAVRNTLYLIKRIFRLCRNERVSAKPCFAYHLGRCPGACIGKISAAEYRKTFEQIERFLSHRQTEILAELRREMKKAAAARRFEKAGTLRDQIRDLERLWERQMIISPKNENLDFLGLYKTDKQAVVNVLLVRGGRVIGQENFSIEHEAADDDEILENFILQYYAEASGIPKEIFIPADLPENKIVSSAISKIKGKKVKIASPRRGKKRRLLRMSAENAQMFYNRELMSFEKRLVRALPDLRNLLNLPTIPRRIEGYDISNIQGANPVGSMIVFQDARPAKSQYRKFKIYQTVSAEVSPWLTKADDFAMMREMLERRFARGKSPNFQFPISNFQTNSKPQIPKFKPWPMSDLIVIDGGKGQLNVAVSALKKYELNIPVIGLAKRLEEIIVPGQKKSIILPPDSPILFLLQQIRDEAHRFAVTFHRGRRGKSQTRSRLDEIAGIGPATRKKMIKKFGSTAAIRDISLEVLAAEVGMDKAKKIKEHI